MSTVNANIRLGYQNAAWFTTNAALVLLSGQIVYRSTDGKYIIGDGVTAVSGLTFYGGVATAYTGSNGITLSGSAFSLGGALTADTNLSGAYTLYMSDASAKFCIGRSNPDRPIEVYSSTGAATMQAYSAKNTAFAGIYAQGDDLAHYAGIIHLGSTWVTSGLRIPNATYLELASNDAFILNEDATGNLRFVVGGSAAANEKLRITTTATTFYGNTVNLDNGTASRILATDSSKNIQFLDTSTYPSLTELSYVKGSTSAIQTQINTKAALGDVYFTTTHFHGAPQTVGTTTLFFNAYPTGNGIAGASGGVGVTVIPFDCTLIGFSLSVLVFGTLGSANNGTIYVRVNNTTDITLSSSVLYSTATSRYSSSALNTNLSAGDYIEIKVVPNCTPTAATSVAQNVTLWFKRR